MQRLYLLMVSYLYSAITLSVPDAASVAEESGSVQVCATLSDVPAGGTVAIHTIVMTTSDGMLFCSCHACAQQGIKQLLWPWACLCVCV